MKSTKTTLYLDAGDYDRIKRIARKRKVTAAALVREAVAQYARRHAPAALPRSIASVHSGVPDLAERFEDYLEGFGEDALSRKR
jgi:predicted transcriptional regulator